MNTAQYLSIEEKTNRRPTQCSCEICREMCHTACLGTPQDILRLIDAGYADRLSYAEWAVGLIHGIMTKTIPMVQAEERNGWCTFYLNGLCELHDKGLKPTEGRLAHHQTCPEDFDPDKNITFIVAREWQRADNLETIKEIVDKLTLFFTKR